MSNQKKLISFMGKNLLKYGFIKNSGKWLLKNEQVALVFFFDKSRFSDNYTLRVCFWFLNLKPLPSTLPHVGGYHMSIDLEKIIPIAHSLTLQFYFSDLINYSASLEERTKICEKESDFVLAQLVNEWTQLDKLKARYFCGDLTAAQIDWEVRDFFGDTTWRDQAATNQEIRIIIAE